MPYTKQTWDDNNAAYPLSAARMTNIENGLYAANSSYSNTLPASPVDGQIAYYKTGTEGIVWQFIYNAASSSAYKWEFVGGISARKDGGAETLSTTINTWIDSPTIVSFVLPRSGDYRAVGWTRFLAPATYVTSVNIGITNGAVVDGAPYSSEPIDANVQTTLSISKTFTGLVSGTDLRLRYAQAVASVGIDSRVLEVVPIRVS